MSKDESTLRKEQAEITRNKLLESARVLFSENGYKGTSVRSINRRVGLADGILYHYFPGGKKELFQTIVTENFIKVERETENMHCREYYGDYSLEDVLMISFDRFTETIESNIDIIRIIVKENDACEFISTENILAVTERNKGFWADFLQKRAENGEIKYIDFEAAASVILSFLINYITLRVMNIRAPFDSNDSNVRKIIKYNVDLWKKEGN